MSLLCLKEESEEEDNNEEEESEDKPEDKTSTHNEDKTCETEELPAEELPVGDVNQAKLDLADKFDSCADEAADIEPLTNGATEANEAKNNEEPVDTDKPKEDSIPQQNGDVEMSQESTQNDSAYASLQPENESSNDSVGDTHTQSSDKMDTSENKEEVSSLMTQTNMSPPATGQTDTVPVQNGEHLSPKNTPVKHTDAIESQESEAAAKSPMLSSPEKKQLRSKSATDVLPSPYIQEKVLGESVSMQYIEIRVTVTLPMFYRLNRQSTDHKAKLLAMMYWPRY